MSPSASTPGGPLADTWWTATGTGPAVVVPRLNVDWTQRDLSLLAQRFRVVVVAPRGFAPSACPGGYDGAGFVGDVERVLDHLGIGTYGAFGYSMNGVMAARLAVGNPRVRAVACGGFPLAADLSGMGDRARRRTEAARKDAQEWAGTVATYDPEAAEAFWEDVAALPAGALSDLGCPTYAWWGAEDAVLSSLLDGDELDRQLKARGVEHDVLPGLDHDGALDRLDLVLPAVVAFLSRSA